SEDLDFARAHILLVRDPLHTAEVIGMRVRVNNRDYGLTRPVVVIEVEAGPGSLYREQRINDDKTGFSFDDGHIGDVVAPDLKDAMRYLEKSVDGIKASLAPQTGVDGRGCLRALLEVECLCVPGRPRSGAGDEPARYDRNQPTLRILEIPVIGKWQRT